MNILKFLKFFNRKPEITKRDYFSVINDFSVFNWRVCLSGDLTHTRKDLDVGSEEMDALAWMVIYDDYIKQIGLGKNYEYILELQKDLAILQLDFVIENDRFLLNNINNLKADIDAAIENSKKGGEDMTTTLIKLGKWAGFKLNERETSVLEIHRMFDLIKKESENKPKI